MTICHILYFLRSEQMKEDFFEMNAQPGVEVNIMPVVGDSSLLKLDESQLPDAIPVLALRNAVVFPGTVFPVTIGREKSIRLIRDAESREGVLGAVPQTDVTVEDPAEGDLAEYGTVCKVVKTLEMPDGSLTAILQGFKRVHVEAVIATEPYLVARVTYEEDFLPKQDEQEMKVLADALKERAGEIIRSSAFAPKEAVGALKAIDNFQFLVNFVATTIEVENFEDRVDLLRYADVHERGMALLKVLDTQVQLLHIKQEINQKVKSDIDQQQREVLDTQVQLLHIKQEINQKVKSDIDQQQREYYLNNQLRTIQEELGMDEGEEFAKLRERADAKKWSKEVRAIFDKEMARLEKYNPSTPDYSIQYNYIQFMLDLPWGEMSEDNLDLKHAQQVLDEDHYGLDQVKERIVEYLAVLKLKGNMKSPILCLYGPPGVGKTSLGKSVARALGRKYVRISLGGMHDEAEIRGHRKTYVGALPGRILNGILASSGPAPPIRSSSWTRSTSSPPTSRATRPARCWRPWTRSRTAPSTTITWTSTMTCRTSCSSPPRTASPPSSRP